MRSMKWPGGKLNEWFSSQGAPLNNLPAVLPFLPSLSSPFPPFRQIVIHPESSENRYERNFLFPSFSSFFFNSSILYRNPVTKRERLVYSNNRIFSKQDSGVDRESFEYSSVNFTVTGLRSRMYNSSAGLKLELFRFFPAIFFFRSLVKKNDESRSDPHLRFNIHIHD